MTTPVPVTATGSDRYGWAVTVRDGSGPMGSGKHDPRPFRTRADVLAAYPHAHLIATTPRSYGPQSGMRNR